MRACLAVEPLEKLPQFARAAFEALWNEGLDLSKDEVLTDLAKQVAVDPDWLLTRIASAEFKDKLRVNTEELIERGGFGSPTMFVADEDMYFGNDRVLLVEHAITRLRQRKLAEPHATGGARSAK